MSESKQSLSCFFPVPFILLIVGGCMYGICKDAGMIEEGFGNETIINMDCGGNDNIARIGWIILMIGVGLQALIFCLIFVGCCIGCFCVD